MTTLRLMRVIAAQSALSVDDQAPPSDTLMATS